MRGIYCRWTACPQPVSYTHLPVAHSVSPAMHNMAFSLLGLDYAYLAFEVGETQLAEAVKGLKLLNARGWNPVSYTHLDVYKRQVYPFLILAKKKPLAF